MARWEAEPLQSSDITGGEKVCLNPVEKPMLEEAADLEEDCDSEGDMSWGSSELGELLSAKEPHTRWRSSWRTSSCGGTPHCYKGEL